MPQINENSKQFNCFVCEMVIQEVEVEYHARVYLPVCETCKGTNAEKQKETELLNGLAEGFVCGCI
ncbi:hypothetical protein [Carboxylicivirga taeanensis]|uniref:hypothetical protein n=1 Tax=Carboxylicivirga taeanensis TaxID=1416875 RepID=UPI003F6E22D6